MSSESTAGLGRWREGKRTKAHPSRTRISARKWLGTTVLTALLLLTAGVLVWIIFKLFPRRDFAPDFVPIFITRYKSPEIPTIPQAAADRDLIRRSTFLVPAGARTKPMKNCLSRSSRIGWIGSAGRGPTNRSSSTFRLMR